MSSMPVNGLSPGSVRRLRERPAGAFWAARLRSTERPSAEEMVLQRSITLAVERSSGSASLDRSAERPRPAPVRGEGPTVDRESSSWRVRADASPSIMGGMPPAVAVSGAPREVPRTPLRDRGAVGVRCDRGDA